MGVTLMMEQYLNIKKDHEDHIVFFRLGDFYEMFFEDAITASKELELTLTGRDCGMEERAPMAGVPHHSSEGYIAKLIEKGYKVAVVEQMEPPQAGKPIVKREVVRIITPGTIIENSMLDEGSNNYISSIYINKKNAGVAFCDVSTGEFQVISINGENKDLEVEIINELSRFMPSEILVNSEIVNQKVLKNFIKRQMPVLIEQLEDDEFNKKDNEKTLTEHFNKKILKDNPVMKSEAAIIASGVLLNYIKNMQKTGVKRITNIKLYEEKEFMNLNIIAAQNLELTKTIRTGEQKGSLLWVLDKTKTAMGKRLFKKTLHQPLLDVNSINRRLNGVDEIYESNILQTEIREALSTIHDLQRLMTRVMYGSTTPRELNSLCHTFTKIPELKNFLSKRKSEILIDINGRIDPLKDVMQLINLSIDDNPPATLKDGGIIRDGFNKQIDELREIVRNTKIYLTKIETEEKEKTKITNLKIGFNRIFGYYLEVTNSHKDKVPKDYIRKQTLTNSERYITEELKEVEEKILGASEKIIDLELILFKEIHEKVAENLERIEATAAAIAELDVIQSFARVSFLNNYTRPEINNSGEINIIDGRHPVVEKTLIEEMFVQNDTNINNDNNQIMLITGPNMAGKSTYMRQSALIIIMAQIGCFVPASRAIIGVVDSVFTRIGASDDLASGKSTFMVEMNEMAHILKYATKNSFIILDEVGRGTSTYDGMSIAQSIIEFIAKNIGAKTMFATHYHQLTDLEKSIPCLKNYNIAVRKQGEDIIFIRRIVLGAVDESYGIEVSKLAGIPDEIVNRAKEILHVMEDNHGGYNNTEFVKKPVKTKLVDSQKEILVELKNMDVETLSPIEALNALYKLKNKLN